MYRSLKKEKFNQFIVSIINKSALFIVSTITIHDSMTGFLYNIVSKIPIFKNKNNITLIMYIVLLIGILYIFIYSLQQIYKKEAVIKIKAENKPKIIIRLGNYEDNMEKLINKIDSTDKDAIFVVGINDNIDGTRAQKRGVHKSVIDKFYTDTESFNSLQSKTEEAFSKLDMTKGKFGEIGIVEHNKNSKILFVINCKYDDEENKSIIGPQPRKIIESVFKELEGRMIDIVQMPIISSKNVVSSDNNKIRFTITIVEIIEEYFKQILNTKNINYDLVLSIKEEDLEANFITLGNIVNFIEELKPMYHIK